MKLQRVQNTLARVVCSTSQFDYIMPILEELHWLPVSSRVEYKMTVLTFKTLSTGEPAYLSELIQLYQPSKNL
jgi:hypothetical protein